MFSKVWISWDQIVDILFTWTSLFPLHLHKGELDQVPGQGRGLYTLKKELLQSDQEVASVSVGMCRDAVLPPLWSLDAQTHCHVTQGPDPIAPPEGIHPPPSRLPLLCGSFLCNGISSLLQELGDSCITDQITGYQSRLSLSTLLRLNFFLLFLFKMVLIVLGSPDKYSLALISDLWPVLWFFTL